MKISTIADLETIVYCLGYYYKISAYIKIEEIFSNQSKNFYKEYKML